MGSGWLDSLRPLCEEARRAAPAPYSVEVVLFYVARWCQKTSRKPNPSIRAFKRSTLRIIAGRIARHLAEDGATIDRLVAGDVDALTDLRRQLSESARSRVGARGDDFVDEGLQKILEVLLTGTPPSRAADELAHGPEGPRNEYIFASPFSNWARTVVINLIRDEWRRAMRTARPDAREAPLDRQLVARARAALPDLLDEIRRLPPKQRSVMVLSLARRDLDEAARDGLHALAPDLFSEAADVAVASDADIARVLGTTPRRVTANRSAARRKLVAHDPVWEFLLDLFLPHRSTRPVEVESDA
jgi:hypothetical protein